MNMKKIKKFFTLSRRAEGFTLVELIVVIAILAILGGVAVPAYSGYVKKANMTADQQLVSEVAHALALYYYSHPDTEGGYVVLKPNAPAMDEDNGNGVGGAAMTAAFGSNWADTATLKYTEWGGGDLITDVVGNYTDEELDNLMDSTFIQMSTPESMMNTVTNMTGLVSDVIAGSDLTKATERLTTLLGEGNSVSTTLADLKIETNDENYSTVVSNLLVNYLAENKENTEDSNLIPIMTIYSGAFAYAEATGDTSVLEQLNTNLEDISFEELCSEDGWYEAVTGGINNAKYDKYLSEHLDTDETALLTMMDGVAHVSGQFTDKASLSDKNLYASDAVSEQVNNYINAIKALAGMKKEEREQLKAQFGEGAIALFLDKNGNVSASSATAYLAG